MKFAVVNPHCSELGAIKRNFNEPFRLFAGWVGDFRGWPDENNLRFFRSVKRQMCVLERISIPQQYSIAGNCRHMPTVTFYVQ